MARDYPTVLDLVGNTPIVRLQRLAESTGSTVLAKLEYLNPGGSVKDRIGLRMIEAAERDGKLKPGGTIVEPTSGNTGVGLAIAAALKGYRCVFVMPDKMSQEKISLLRAYGAEVVICPTAVEPESPESYYSVSDRLAEEIPGAYKPNQYANMANPQAHFETTGPEIWEQTGGDVQAVVIALGTGGTVSGVARYLKQQDPSIRIVGADPEGSIYSQPNDVHPYLVEGIGEDFYPTTMDLDVIDDFVTVSDRDSFLTARRMAREEGLLVGGSGGTAVHAALEVARGMPAGSTVLTLIPDSGRAYLSRFYDDTYLIQYGFLERDQPAPSVADVLAAKRDDRHDHEMPDLVVIQGSQTVGEAIELMQRYGISQLPVAREDPPGLADLVGSVHERSVLDRVFTNPDALRDGVAQAMQPPLHVIDAAESIDRVYADLTGGSPAVVVAAGGRPAGMLTRSDLLEYLAHTRTPQMTRTVSVAQLRRHVIAAQGYASRSRRGRPVEVAATVARLAAVQLDSISTVDRSHRITLASRVGAYPRATVSGLLERGALFEYWAHECCLLPVADWPLYRHVMVNDGASHPWWGAVIEKEPQLADQVLGEIRERGPLGSRHFEGQRGTGMWSLKPAKRMLEALWTAGQLVIAGRQGFQRLYDLPERVLPDQVLGAPVPGADEYMRTLIVRAVGARGALTESGIVEHNRLRGGVARIRPHVEHLVDEGVLERVAVADGGAPVLVEAGAPVGSRTPTAAVFLSPFDNLLWDRPFAQRVIGFDHLIEVYKRPHERRYGYYVLPFVHGDRIVGRADLKTDRAAGELRLQAFHPEPRVRWTATREEAMERALARLADVVGVSSIVRA